MKKIVLLCAALVVGAAFLSAPAEAGPRWVATMASTDGGVASAPVKVSPKVTYCITAAQVQTAMKLDTCDGGSCGWGPTIDVTKDFVIPWDTSRLWGEYCFETGSRTVLVTQNVDGGTTNNAKLYILEKNPTLSP
jgi:hypothetical protein